MAVSHKEKLTILIPTRDRHEKLERVLHYIDNVGNPFQIFILDSSTEKFDYQKYSGLMGRNRINCMKYDPNLHLLEKIQQGLQHVQTPYVVLWADDDFLIIPALSKGVGVLENHKECSVVSGLGCLFTVDYNREQCRIKAVSSYPQRAVTDDVASTRLGNHLSKYSTTYYSIHRTEDFKENINWCCEHKFYDCNGEMALTCFSMVQGTSEHLDQLYLMRECHAGQGSTEVPTKIEKDGEFGWDYQNLCQALSEMLHEKENIPHLEAFKKAREPLLCYFRLSEKNKMKGKAKKRLKAFIKDNPILKGMILPLWRFAKNNSYDIEDLSLPALLDSRSPSHKDFMPIFEVITQPREDQK